MKPPHYACSRGVAEVLTGRGSLGSYKVGEALATFSNYNLESKIFLTFMMGNVRTNSLSPSEAVRVDSAEVIDDYTDLQELLIYIECSSQHAEVATVVHHCLDANRQDFADLQDFPIYRDFSPQHRNVADLDYHCHETNEEDYVDLQEFPIYVDFRIAQS